MDKKTQIFAAFIVAALMYHDVVLTRTITQLRNLWEWNYQQAIDQAFEDLANRFHED